MKKLILNLFLIALVTVCVAENNKNKTQVIAINDDAVVDFSGVITDGKTGESLAGVEVSLKGNEKMKTYTDFDGKFLFKNVKKGNYDIVSTYISYEKQLVKNVQVDQTTNQLEIILKNSN
ncbi:MAG TPA: DUF2012 domain-containing protein [Prolixibacteraceae bacterium]|nr:DUF2012 domain-containing protein [Prolixibacteraceae bacterium]